MALRGGQEELSGKDRHRRKGLGTCAVPPAGWAEDGQAAGLSVT